MSQPFMGEIKAVGFPFAPVQYAFCNGATLSIAQNQALFALLGTTYGGNGVQTYQLPNLGGRVAVGQGQSPGTSNYAIGQVAGTESVSLNSQQLPMHTHAATTSVTPNSSGLTATTTINVATGVPPASRANTPVGNILTLPVVGGAGTAVNAFAPPGTGTAAQMATGAATTTVGGQFTAGATTTVQPAGASLPVEILQPYLAINYIIAVQGIFPSRN